MLAPASTALAGAAHKVVHRLVQARLAVGGLEENGQRDGFEAGLVDVFELGEFLVGQDRRLQLDEIAARRLGLEQIALGADGRLGRGDEFLADAVDRRIGDLGEELLEIVVEQLRLVGEHGQRRVAAHRADGFDAVAGHGGHEDAQVFEGVAEGLLALQHGVVARLGHVRRRRRRRPDRSRCSLSHCAVGLLGGDLVLDLLVGDDPALLGVDQEHAARLQPALVQDALRRRCPARRLRRP